MGHKIINFVECFTLNNINSILAFYYILDFVKENMHFHDVTKKEFLPQYGRFPIVVNIHILENLPHDYYIHLLGFAALKKKKIFK